MLFQTRSLLLLSTGLAYLLAGPLNSEATQKRGPGPKRTRAARTVPTSLKIGPILGKTRDVYEKVLGKPVGGEEGEYTYRVTGFSTVVVTGGYQGRPMANIALRFKRRPPDWKTALTAVGLNPAGAIVGDPGKMAGKAEYIEKIKDTPSGWQAVWTPAEGELTLFGPDSP